VKAEVCQWLQILKPDYFSVRIEKVKYH
jgi:hypothetical protein